MTCHRDEYEDLRDALIRGYMQDEFEMDSAGFTTGEKREILGARYGRNMYEFMESLDSLD